MSIDWEKTGRDLNKTQKVKSQFLVELKKKIEFLEINLDQTKNDLKLVVAQFNNSKKANLNLITENENLKNNIVEKDGLISEIRKVEKELTIKVETLSLENEEIKCESASTKKRFENEIADLTSVYESKINEIKLSEKQREDALEALRHDFKIYNENSEKLRDENKKLNKENLKLNSQVSEKTTIISTLNEKVRETEKLVNSQRLYIEQIEEKEETNNQLDKFQTFGEHRITCPLCHATGSDIKEVEDRNKILDYYDHKPIYAKKRECKKCGYKF